MTRRLQRPKPVIRANSSQRVVLDVWRHIEPRFGGVGPAAAGLATAVCNSSRWRSDLIAMCDRTETERHSDIPHTVRTLTVDLPRPFSDMSTGRQLRDAVSNCDICHVHGTWQPHSLAARRLAHHLHKPLVCSVHSMLCDWELRNKKLKKSIYSCLFERPSLSRSSCLRALSEREAGEYRKFGLTVPIAIVPNGIHPLPKVAPSAFLTRFPNLRGKSIILFLGRIHFQKGVLNLLSAWAHITRRHSEGHLLLAGPEHPETARRVRDFLHDQKLESSVTLPGILNGELKAAALSSARYLCLPSYSEGLSFSVLEALSTGLPVIITPECNMEVVEKSGAGCITSNRPEPLAETVSSCLQLDTNRWRNMSENAAALARTKFAWSNVAADMRSVYEWLLGGPKPACVIG